MLEQNEIIKTLKKYSPEINESLIKNAYLYMLDKHGIQVRESGEPYFIHPVNVSQILLSLKMDQYTIIAGLLHDTVEDTDATFEEIEKLFGKNIMTLVSGVTKLSKIEITDIALKQEENYKRLLLAAAEDIRVLIIKLADRLHNMRTLRYKRSAHKRKSIAIETIQIYAPLAGRIGLQTIKDELQNIAFYSLYPKLYNSIRERLKILYQSSDEIIHSIKDGLTEVLTELNSPYKIEGRIKTPYSIWNKMNVRTLSFDNLSDIMAFRIIVNTIADCYQTLGIIHKHFPVIPGRFRDYISVPKNNQYQSLHTCIIGPLHKRIEIQIRTQKMHEKAEYGIAAHWEYKEGISQTEDYGWLKQMVQAFNKSKTMDEFVKYSRTKLKSEHTFALTPKGLIVSLPMKATALDFAYILNPELANKTYKIKINDIESSFDTIVNCGDKIELITQDKLCVEPEWLNYVTTEQAKSDIKYALNSSDNLEQKGKNIFRKTFQNALQDTELSQKIMNELLQKFNCTNEKEFYISIGSNKINLDQVADDYIENNHPLANIVIGLPSTTFIKHTDCCYPVPGEKIIGIVHSDNSSEVHREHCNQVKILSYKPEVSIVDVYWNKIQDFDEPKYLSRFLIITNNSECDINYLNSIVHENNSTITKYTVTNSNNITSNNITNNNITSNNIPSSNTINSITTSSNIIDSNILYNNVTRNNVACNNVTCNDVIEIYLECLVANIMHLLSLLRSFSASPLINSIKRIG